MLRPWIAWVGLGLPLLVACGTTPEARYYRIPDNPLSLAAIPSTGKTAAVTRVQAAAPLRQSGLLTRSGDYEVRATPDHRWEAAPAEIVEGKLVAALRRSGMFTRVERGAGEADILLRPSLTHFEAVEGGGQWTAEVGVDLQIYPAGRPPHTVKAHHRTPAADGNPAAIARAMHQSLDACLVEIVQALSVSLSSR